MTANTKQKQMSFDNPQSAVPMREHALIIFPAQRNRFQQVLLCQPTPSRKSRTFSGRANLTRRLILPQRLKNLDELTVIESPRVAYLGTPYPRRSQTQ